jgi:ADP-heptose:LPS heptosyltransferase
MLLGAMCGARVRIGSTSLPFGHDLSARFYSLELPLPDEAALARMHEGEHNLYPLAAIGVDERDLSSILVPTRAEELDCANFVQAVVPEGDRFIVVHPGAGKKQNVWPPHNFAAVVRGLHERFGLRSVAVRGPVDGEVFDDLLRASAPPPAVLSCPSVGFLGALMNRASLTLCNDTGTMHIAGAVGARCIAVFGPTDPARWKPACDCVLAVRAPDGRVTSVTADEVLSRAVSLLTEPISGRA